MDKPDHISQEDWDSVDSPPLPEGFFAKAKTAESALPPAFLQALREGRVGRPKSANKKQIVSLRIDPDVIDAWRASGTNWQARINDLLREHQPRS